MSFTYPFTCFTLTYSLTLSTLSIPYNYKYKIQSMSNNTILVASQYKGAILAAKILKDWEFATRIGGTYAGQALIILDERQQDQYLKYAAHKIILKGTQMSPHHILALSGVLVTFGQQKEFFFPKLIVESTASNGLAILAMQILYKQTKPTTQYVSLVELIKYFGAFNVSAKQVGMIRKPRGQNVLEGGASYYCVYPCKEGMLAVGNLQPKFYSEMIRGLDLTNEQREFCQQGQMVEESQQSLRTILSKKFREKTAAQWEKHFLNYDTCITEIRMPFNYGVREPRMIQLKSKM